MATANGSLGRNWDGGYADKTSAIKRYVQNHGIPERYRSLSGDGKVAPFSGAAEIWFDSVEALEAAFNEAEYLARVQPDEGKFIAKPTTRFIIQERQVI